MVDGLADEDKGEDDHGDGGDPGDQVEEETVGVLAHEVFAIDEEEDEDDDDGEPDAVADLRKDEDFPERSVGEKNDAAADEDEDGVEPVEGGGFPKFVVETCFEAHALADDVSGGEREDGGGEEGGIEEAKSEGPGGPLPCQRNQSFGGFRGVRDVVETVVVEGGGGEPEHAGRVEGRAEETSRRAGWRTLNPPDYTAS